METIKVSNGVVVNCRSVPPYSLGAVHRRLKEPSFPKVTIHSAAGSSEDHPALPETPEFAAYQDAMRKYRSQLAVETMEFQVNYSVRSWKTPGSEVFISMPPKDWKPDEMYLAYSGEDLAKCDAMHIRYLYIILEILTTQGDVEMLEEAVEAKKGDPLSKGEVEAALSPFESKTPSIDH